MANQFSLDGCTIYLKKPVSYHHSKISNQLSKMRTTQRKMKIEVVDKTVGKIRQSQM